MYNIKRGDFMLCLNPNDKIECQPFIVRKIYKKVSQNKKEYYHLQISHGIKNYDAKIWNFKDEISVNITPGCFANVWGTVKDFKGNLQIHIDKILKIENPDEDLIQQITPTCNTDPLKLEIEINKLISSVKHPKLNSLLNSIFNLPEIINNFYLKAAGAEIHHAYIGGLAEHTIEVTKIVIFLCNIYNYINRDLAVTASLLHDIGKVIELSNFPENKYTDAGRMLGHIYLGTDLISAEANKIADFPNDLLLDLKHCILAHHGTLEMGSPVVPMTIEAIALHNADKMSAEINGFNLAIQRDTNTGNWTEFNNIYKRYIKK
ncbi:HD domain-containing protein [Caloramator sp. E03]|nr:HD domain-containing protein [Caloramator sp. E03]